MPKRVSKKTIVATRQIISALQMEGEIRMTDMEVILQYSASGTRKHVSRLRAAGIVTTRMVITKTGGHALIRLIEDGEKVAAFLKHVDAGNSIQTPVVRKPRIASFSIGTMVHEMIDDLGLRIRKNTNVVVRRDPLIAAFFGPAGQGESNV